MALLWSLHGLLPCLWVSSSLDLTDSVPFPLAQCSWSAETNKIEITFTEQSPITADKYYVTVFEHLSEGGQDEDVANWKDVELTTSTTTVGSDKKMTITATAGATPSWPGAGDRVHAAC